MAEESGHSVPQRSYFGMIYGTEEGPKEAW